MTFRLDSPSVLVPVVTLYLQQSVVVAVTQRAHLYRERLPCWIQGVLYNFSFVNYCESKITPRIGVVLRSRTLVRCEALTTRPRCCGRRAGRGRTCRRSPSCRASCRTTASSLPPSMTSALPLTLLANTTATIITDQLHFPHLHHVKTLTN